ncbi:PREDICTED: SUMO-activating enzyme subunit 2-B-like [Acropora digitifera]|uniref:SUMO-activating enzyme subunit 2-B-like n=1 Tax=Acropora digitifera TaxID=70779 RepID=UPI00077A085C|nr:PREDICTED: SUMO-activating enzyme subunit 2-B-like [Acropora digitifera]
MISPTSYVLHCFFIDLDTIDVSNLNRQFLFQKKHVGKSKAQVSRESALRFNPDAKIIARHDNVMSSEYSMDYFKQFNVVMNALDNRDCSQLFGEADADEEVSPDTEDPEAVGTAGEKAALNEEKEGVVGGIERASTRTWAEEIQYDPVRLFNKVSIEYNVTKCDRFLKHDNSHGENFGRKTLKLGFTPQQGLKYIARSLFVLKERFGMVAPDVEIEDGKGSILISSEEGETEENLPKTLSEFHVGNSARLKADDFLQNYQLVLNIRHRDSLENDAEFEVEGDVPVPRPSSPQPGPSTQGVEADGKVKAACAFCCLCVQIYLNRQPNPRKRLLVPCMLDPPNPKCYVCATKPEVTVFLNTTTLTVKTLEEKVLKERFGMVAPDVEIEDGKGSILISSEEGETEENLPKTLSEFHVGNSARLKADDFLQNYQLVLNIRHRDSLENDAEFEVEGDVPVPRPSSPQPGPSTQGVEADGKVKAGEDEDVMVVDEPAPSRKRKAEETQPEEEMKETANSNKAKRARISNAAEQIEDDVIVL